MKLQQVQLPRVEFLENGKVCFQQDATLQDVAICLEVSAANWSGLENGEYKVGHSYSFHRLASGETLCGRINTFPKKTFMIEAILLKDKRTLIEKSLGYQRNPEFQSLLNSFGIQDVIDLGASEN